MSSLLTFQIQQQQNTKKTNNDITGLPSPPNSFCGDNNNEQLQNVFSDMTLKDYSVSLPENYTIEHHPQHKLPISTATAAATGGLTIRHRRQSENIMRKNRCHDCGKSYKSPACLQKHRWEHSEEWKLTKSLPLTKHQQVQMLEAAAILIAIKKEDKREEDSDESIVIDDDDDDEILSITSNSSSVFMEDL